MTTNNTYVNSSKAVIFAKTLHCDKKDDNSTTAQILQMKEYCTQKGFEIIKEIEFIEGSSKAKKKQFYEMIEFIKNQNESVALICDSVNKLQSNFKEVPILEELRLNGKITIHFLREGQILDKESNLTDLVAYLVFILMSEACAKLNPTKAREDSEQQLYIS